MELRAMKIFFICLLTFTLAIVLISKSLIQHAYNKRTCSRIATNDILDYHKLINLLSFSFILLPKIDNAAKKFIVAVHSKTSHFDKRQTIRETWGQYENVTVVFMLALSGNETIEGWVKDEHDEYNDLVQGDFRENYCNMSYKHVMVLKYFTYHCKNVEYLIKTDDDVFVNTPFLVEYLQSYKENDKVACLKVRHNPVKREGRYAITKMEFPNRFYPTHCSGAGIIYPRGLVLAIYVQAQCAKFFWIDDVYITGMITKQLGIEILAINHLGLSWKDIVKGHIDKKTKFIFGIFEFNAAEMKKLWQLVLKNLSQKNPK